MTSTAAGPVVPWTARLPWVLLAVSTALVIVSVPLSLGQEPLSDTLLYGLIATTVATTGALVASRQPDNPIGWILCAQGVEKSQLEAWGEGFSYHHLPTAAVGAWVSNWTWLIDGAAYAVVFALFPTGVLLSRRWRLLPWLLGAAVLIAIVGQEMSTSLFAIGMILLLLGTAGSVGSLIVRFRRSSGTERLQLKQLVLAAGLILPAMAVSVPFYEGSLIVQYMLGLAFLALPVAVGVAILRYRLYDIDVVINRTLVYGALTALLAGTYLGSVLLLQLALDTVTQGSGLAVAGSTLGTAALVRPARARIQYAVDRRFFRAKYDASRTLARYTVHLRDQVDLVDIGSDLLAVVRTTVQPAHASLWLRTPTVDR